MKTWKRYVTRAAALALLTSLGACGGGDGSSGGGSGITSISATQQAADDVVVEANYLAEKILQADASGLVPSEFVPAGSAKASLPTGVTTSDTLSCSEITGNEADSGSVSFTVNTTSAGDLISIDLKYNDCTFVDGDYSVTMDGTMALDFDYVNEDDYSFTTAFDLVFTTNDGGDVDSIHIETTSVCDVTTETFSCRYRAGDYEFDTFFVDTSGDLPLITEASLESPNISVSFDNWTYDRATGRATSGTAVIQDASGNVAEITATSTGYTVDITIGGMTTSYTVNFS